MLVKNLSKEIYADLMSRKISCHLCVKNNQRNSRARRDEKVSNSLFSSGVWSKFKESKSLKNDICGKRTSFVTRQIKNLELARSCKNHGGL